MRDSKRQLAGALAPVLKVAGYRKRALNWHRESKDTISVFNLQRSQWGDQFYINCAIYLKALGSEKTPPEYRCQVRTRIDDLVPRRSRLSALLDFEKKLKEETRLRELVTLVTSFALPWLEKYAEIEELKSLVCSDKASHMAIDRTIREHFTRNERRRRRTRRCT
jgi:hypothetical protein